MKEFNLSEWLANPSRKVVTRDGREARIVCTDLKNDHPIIAAIKGDNSELPYYYDINGKCLFYDSKDIFFADEEGLTEFEKEVDAIIDKDVRRNIGVKCEAKNLLNLARKELVPIQDTKAYQEGVKEGRRLEREDLEKIIEDKVAEKVAELLNNLPTQSPLQPNPYPNPFQPISVLYGCPSIFPDITYSTKTQQDNE